MQYLQRFFSSITNVMLWVLIRNALFLFSSTTQILVEKQEKCQYVLVEIKHLIWSYGKTSINLLKIEKKPWPMF